MFLCLIAEAYDVCLTILIMTIVLMILVKVVGVDH